MRLALALIALAMVAIVPRAAFAHAIGLSKGDYVVAPSGAVDAELTFARGDVLALVPSLDANRDANVDDAELAAARAELARAISSGVVVRGDGNACPAALLEASLTEADGIVVRAAFACAPSPAIVAIDLPLLESLPHGHRHVARAQRGDAVVDEMLFRGHAAMQIAGAVPAVAPTPSFFGFLKMGVEHILTGYDHLLFLFGLVLVGGRARSLVGIVTAFTIAHSITLAVAAFGVWSPPSRVVEPAIAASIAYVGVENFVVKDAAKRWRITFPFGLIHGFGFAGALQDVHLSRAQIPTALVAFNVGVELGQLAVMAAVLPIVLLLRTRDAFRGRGVQALSGCVVALGVYWFVERIASP